MNPIGPSARPDHAYAGPQTRSQWARRIPELLEDLREAFQSTSTFHLYSQVAVIAMHWENDDLNVLPLETELLQTLRDDYGFLTSSYTIPTTNCPNPQTRLLQHLLAWTTQHSGENTLRMYVYSGHAGNAGYQSIQWHLAGALNRNGRLTGPSINWWDIRGNLEVDPGAVCYVFDCCSAASGVLKDYAGAEFVAASAWEQPASLSQNFCFTRAFIDALKGLKGQNSTLADVYATIVRHAKDSQIEVLPIHIPKPGTRSVTIGHQDRPMRPAGGCQLKVLLSVNINDPNALNITDWKEWLSSNLPPTIRPEDLEIEGLYAGSTVILFTVPIQAWCFLPKNHAYTFISMVTSGNMLPPWRPSLPSRVAPPLNENQPFAGGSHKPIR